MYTVISQDIFSFFFEAETKYSNIKFAVLGVVHKLQQDRPGAAVHETPVRERKRPRQVLTNYMSSVQNIHQREGARRVQK